MSSDREAHVASSAQQIEIELESFVVEACEICRMVIQPDEEVAEMGDRAKPGSTLFCHVECGASAGLELVKRR